MREKIVMDIVRDEGQYTPQHISDKIIEDLISKLLSDRKYYPKQPESFKYELSVKDSYFENHLRQGAKKMPRTNSNTIPASHSRLEFEIMKITAGKLGVSGIITTDRNQKIKVTIPGVADTYYVEIEAGKLRRLLQQYMVDTITKSCAGGEKIFAVMVIDCIEKWS